MKLYLLRHAHRGNGEKQDTLTEIGVEQAKRTGKYFSKIELDKIISGDSNRARETAKEIIKLNKCKVEYTALVNEQSLGVLEGKSGKDYKLALNSSGLSEEEFRPEKGENALDAYNRAIKFFEMLKKEQSSSILIVSHSGFISNLITLLLKFPVNENVHFKTQFCSVSYFEIDDNFKVNDFYINDITHLASESASASINLEKP